MTIEFPAKTATCGHASPVFGCKGCIDSDRESAIKEFFSTADRPDCPRHGEMMLATGNRLTMMITYECCHGVCSYTVQVPVR